MSRHSSRKEILGVETSEINTMNILLKVSQLLLLSSPVWSSAVGNPSCGHALDLPSVIFLDKFCTDCYNVYRLDEVYQNCQADCYDNDVFFFCLNVTLVTQETAARAAGIILALAEPRYVESDLFS